MSAPRRDEQPSAGDDWVAVGEVARPHGVRGELRLKLFNRESDVLLDVDRVRLRSRDGVEREMNLEGVRRADAAMLVKLAGVDDRDQVEELRGARVSVPRASLPALGDGEFYAHDVIGRVAVLPDGAVVGTIADLVSYPTVDVLVVRDAEGGRWEVPAIEQYLDVPRPGADRVALRTLEGLEREAPRTKKS